MFYNASTPKFAQKSINMKVHLHGKEFKTNGIVESTQTYDLNSLAKAINLELSQNIEILLYMDENSRLMVKTKVKEQKPVSSVKMNDAFETRLNSTQELLKNNKFAVEVSRFQSSSHIENKSMGHFTDKILTK